MCDMEVMFDLRSLCTHVIVPDQDMTLEFNTSPR